MSAPVTVRPRLTRRRRIVGLVALAAVVVLAGGTFAAWRAVSGNGRAPVPHFVDETATAGIDLTYGGDDTFDVGGGVAVFDCDGDGLPDVYTAGGGGPAALFRNESAVGGALRFG